jgi:hypothetical protein
VRLAPPYRLGAAILVAAALVAGGLVGAAPASAADTSTPRIFGQTLRGAAIPGPVRPSARAAALASDSSSPTSTWVVRYDAGFQANAQARAAFQAAVDIWSRLIKAPSTAVINVDASAVKLEPGVLGQAGPKSFVALSRDGRGGSARTDYPVALASALTGRDLAPVDIAAEFDLQPPDNDVYFGTDGQAQGKYDFETVVLHELGHGLGFLGSMDVDTDRYGFWGGGPQHPEPTVYDRFTMQSGGAVQGKRLLSYPSGSLALGSALTSGDVYWDGPLGKAAHNGRPPRLYAPRPWEPGSSYSHLSVADFPQTDVNSLMTAVLSPSQVKRDPGPVVLGMFADMGWGVPATPGVPYSPIDPVRLLDSRNGTGGLLGRLGPGRTFDLSVVGGSTGVPTTATAVVLNVTGITPAAPTDVRLYPTPRSGTAQPLVSNLNLTAGATRANLVTVPVGENGRVRILNSGGAPHLLVDVQGWYGAGAASRFQPADPARLLDTRTGPDPVALGAGQYVDLTVIGGPRSVPDTATAVIMTVTAVNASNGSDIRVYPTPSDATTPPPEISTLNVSPQQIVPNLVIVKVGFGGQVRLRNSAGVVDLVADLAGWFDEDPGGALFHALAPQRILDTRSQAVKRVGAGETRDLPLGGVAGVPATGAAAVAVNVTGVDATQSTDVAVYPTPNDSSFPLTSNLNLRAHETAADLAVAATGLGGQIRLRNSTGEVALVVDIVGWFGP